MKSLTFLSLLLTLMWAPAGQAMTNYYSPEERCREITLEKAGIQFDLVETVKSDLISGKWVLKMNFSDLPIQNLPKLPSTLQLWNG
ncbi:MAG: hypothetical protein R2784_10465 [Saprospiraceae bacterium]